LQLQLKYNAQILISFPESFNMASSPDNAPVGSIIAFGADELPANMASEWRMCHGDDMSKSEYPALYKILGLSNGGEVTGDRFFLPDLRGYFLRGVDATGTVDKDNHKRTAPNGQPAAGLAGSTQSFGTALPQNQLAARIPNISNDYHYVNGGDSGVLAYQMCAWNDGTQTFAVNMAGAAETVPSNTYVNFIIKVGQSTSVPVGCIVAFAGMPNKAPNVYGKLWGKCEAVQGDPSVQQFEALYSVIGQRYGLSGDGMFLFPDFQGQFLRGVDTNSGRDKNGNRSPPLGLPGSKDPVAGSTQTHNTGPPSTQGWACDIAHHYNGNNVHEVFEIAGHTNCRDTDWNNTVWWQGGDKETRPTNIGVMYLMCMQGTSSPSPGSDTLPIGAIVSIPGEGKPDSNYWALCDGSEVSCHGIFAALYKVCGPVWGKPDGKDTFNLPDMRGQFLRGVDNSPAGAQLKDPDRDSRLATKPGGATKGIGSSQSYATAISNISMDPSLNYPTRHWDNAAGAWTNKAAAWNSDTTTFPIKGGDVESRPINVAVHRYIKINVA
jgi:microcystin-dependent protein